ncbi:MAG TPA: metal ABC transporter ATP-binding protein [Gemmatales bacterium]|nr:metal ABC transporter ATP-binding protein [Gemmatales bacterium]
MADEMPAVPAAASANGPRVGPLVTIENLHVTLGQVSILKGLSAEIARGRISALIGLNGAGKTTLLRALLGEVPSTGTIRFHCGHDHRQKYPQHLGYVPQRLHYDPHMPVTVCELMGLALRRRPLFFGLGRRLRTQVSELLRLVHAERLIDYSVGGLSGGELQRVLLALALEPQPELLLLDEPAAGIDFQHQGEFYRLIGELNERTGVTIVLVSHDLSVVSKVAHRVLCLNEGRIQCAGTPEEVLTGEMVQRIFGADKGVFAHRH